MLKTNSYTLCVVCRARCFRRLTRKHAQHVRSQLDSKDLVTGRLCMRPVNLFPHGEEVLGEFKAIDATLAKVVLRT